MKEVRDGEHAVSERCTPSRKQDATIPVNAWSGDKQGHEKALISKVYWGLLPWMFMTGMFTYFDRANFSFAAPSLRHDLGLSNAAYGLASGERGKYPSQQLFLL